MGSRRWSGREEGRSEREKVHNLEWEKRGGSINSWREKGAQNFEHRKGEGVHNLDWEEGVRVSITWNGRRVGEVHNITCLREEVGGGITCNRRREGRGP
jgi:hypothetical protein